MEEITYRQLLDYVVGVVYHLRIKLKRTGFFSLSVIIEYFEYPATFEEVRDISKYLEAKGYVKAIYTFGDVFLEITTRGIIYIEEKDKDFYPTLEAFLIRRKINEKIKKTANQLNNDLYLSAKTNLINELKAFETKISKKKKDDSLNDFLSDLYILISELNKVKPDKEILAHKTNRLLEKIEYRDKLSKILSKINIE